MSHSKTTDSKLLLIRVPHDNSQNANVFDQFLDNIHGLFEEDVFSFEVVSLHQHIYLFVWCGASLADTMSGQLYAKYPFAEIDEMQDYASPHVLESGLKFAGAEMRLKRSDLFPFKTYVHFEGSSLSAIFATLSKAQSDEQVWIQFVVKPAAEEGQLSFVRKFRLKWERWKSRFDFSRYFRTKSRREITEKEQKSVFHKAEKDTFYVSMRIAYFARDEKVAASKLHAITKAFSQFTDPDLNAIEVGSFTKNPDFLKLYASRKFGKNRFVFNSEEIATLYHLPHGGKHEIPSLVCTVSKKAEPPLDLPRESTAASAEISFFAESNFHNHFTRFGMKRVDRRRHLYVIGKSGVGKSKMLELLILSDIFAGKGVCVMDPHGDLVDDVMRFIPENRVDDVVLFNPADLEYPVGFNPIGTVEPEYRQHVAMGFIEIFKKMFGANWTPRLEHVLRYTVLALFECPNSTIFGILKMLTDKNYRQRVVARVQDTVVKNFWVNEFAGWSEKFDNEAIVPVLNKVGQFVSTQLVRNIVGQPKNLIDMSEIMEKQKIFLVKVSKGNLSEEISALMGSMIVTNIYQAAMKRAVIPEEQRKDFYFYVDEFQNFATKTFGEILSEARKYRLNLTVSHQLIGQLTEDIRATVFGNVGSIIAFRVGAEDAFFLEKEFSPIFKANDIINLGVQELYIKMSIDGRLRDPFSARTLMMPKPTNDLTALIIEKSRAKYGRPRAEVEKIIERLDRGDEDFDDGGKGAVGGDYGGGGGKNSRSGGGEGGGEGGGNSPSGPVLEEKFVAPMV